MTRVRITRTCRVPMGAAEERAFPAGWEGDVSSFAAAALVAEGAAIALGDLTPDASVTPEDVARAVVEDGDTIASGAPDLEALNEALAAAGLRPVASAAERDALWRRASA